MHQNFIFKTHINHKSMNAKNLQNSLGHEDNYGTRKNEHNLKHQCYSTSIGCQWSIESNTR